MSELGRNKFNDDLLIDEKDQKLALLSFPRLAPVLIFPELVSKFAEFERDANNAKKASRRIGILAVCFGALALLGAAGAPLIEKLQQPWPEVIGLSLALFGVTGVSIGAFGVFFAKAKHRWLTARLMTERLRQFHLQTLAFRTSSVLGAMRGSVHLAAFLEQRKQWLAHLELNHINHLPGRLKAVVDDEAEEQFRLHTYEEFELALQPSPLLEEVFDAYRLLRFEHQIGYASVKLGDEHLNQPLKQQSLLATISWSSILVVFALHLLIALSMKPGWLIFMKDAHWVHVVVLWAAIGALCARAFEEGLQPTREVARYLGYRAAMIALERAFDEAKAPTDKIRLMQMTERAMYQEMRGFLKTNHESRFVL